MFISNRPLGEKTVIVTGSSRGIGKAIALAFAKEGANVVLCGRNASSLDNVVSEVQKYGNPFSTVKVDVTQKSTVDNLVVSTIKKFSTIDILVNCAAAIVRKSVLEHSEDDWDRVIDISLKGYYLCSQAVGKYMVNQGKGNIINISSVLGINAAINRCAYCVAKAGVIMLTKVLALEFAKHGIRVNAIAPSTVKTETNEELWKDPEQLKKLESGVPLGYLAETVDVANSVLFLASDSSRYIAGHTLVLDGGKLTKLA